MGDVAVEGHIALAMRTVELVEEAAPERAGEHLDVWSRRIVGYALGRRIDARLTLAAFTTVIEGRSLPPGCIHHSNRGSQYAAQAYRTLLGEHRLAGSMGRRGNPYDNAMMESFIASSRP